MTFVSNDEPKQIQYIEKTRTICNWSYLCFCWGFYLVYQIHINMSDRKRNSFLYYESPDESMCSVQPRFSCHNRPFFIAYFTGVFILYCSLDCAINLTASIHYLSRFVPSGVTGVTNYRPNTPEQVRAVEWQSCHWEELQLFLFSLNKD